MLILEAFGIKKYFGERCLLDINHLQIYSGHKIGLLGPNGVGKTTLLRILTGEMKADEGYVNMFGEYRYLPQLDLDQGQIELERAKEWSAELEIRNTLSGGEKTRYKIAHLLSGSVHLLIADEPTANLDIEGIEQLEKELYEFDGAILFVSHDRDLLDHVCNTIWELDRGTITVYPGNYSLYQAQKKIGWETQEREYEEYVKEKERLRKAIALSREKSRSVKKAPSRMGISEARLHKGTAKAKKAKLDQGVKALESRLEQLEEKEKPWDPKTAAIDMQPPSPLHNPFVFQIGGLSKSFPGKQLFNDVSFTVKNGSKVALIGPNGSGKTTLLNMLVNGASGVKTASGVKLGYFSQELEILDEEQTILENVMETSIYPESFARLILARLLFRGDAIYKPVSLLSGGERVKCGFGKVFLQDVNVLILDEPTNYLDLDSMEALGQVLEEYPGTVLFVSHDRRFIDQVATDLLIIENYTITSFKGNYTEYEGWKEGQSSTSSKLMVLENRLADVLGRLSVPGPDDNLELLDQEFKELVREIGEIKNS